MTFSTDFRLSIQRALWGMITPSIRAIALEWEQDIGEARFIFDDVPGEYERELIDEIESEVIADFADGTEFVFSMESGRETNLSFEAGEQWWAFVRREGRELGPESR